ncbi:MAG TPA: epimerase, partial [Mycobacterium sp.]|nr:epimerase [Mycobacterium sp.]
MNAATPVIAIADSSGLISSALAATLRAADHTVLRIVRQAPANSDELHWNPESGEFDSDAL